MSSLNVNLNPTLRLQRTDAINDYHLPGLIWRAIGSNVNGNTPGTCKWKEVSNNNQNELF